MNCVGYVVITGRDAMLILFVEPPVTSVVATPSGAVPVIDKVRVEFVNERLVSGALVVPKAFVTINVPFVIVIAALPPPLVMVLARTVPLETFNVPEGETIVVLVA